MHLSIDPDKLANEDYRISFEEYKLLLTWTNSLADRRQETSNLFFGVSGALLTLASLVLIQLEGTQRVVALVLLTIIGMVVSIVWASLLQRYREILRFKYAQLELFEEVLGLSGLVSAENDFFRSGKPLEVCGKKAKLAPPSKLGRFGITLAERNLALLFGVIFAILLLVGIMYH